MNGADFGTSELIYPENIIINGFHFPYPLNGKISRRFDVWRLKILVEIFRGDFFLEGGFFFKKSRGGGRR